jgi:hypothetical protein
MAVPGFQVMMRPVLDVLEGMEGRIGGPRQRVHYSRCPSCRISWARARKFGRSLQRAARVMHERPWRDRGDGPVAGQPTGGVAGVDLRRTCSARRKVRCARF